MATNKEKDRRRWKMERMGYVEDRKGFGQMRQIWQMRKC